MDSHKKGIPVWNYKAKSLKLIEAEHLPQQIPSHHDRKLSADFQLPQDTDRTLE